MTQSYSVTSGGVRTYLHAKQKAIRNTEHSHILIVPGESDRVIRTHNLTTCTIRGVPIPNCKPYRFLLRLDKVQQILRSEMPDIIELGDSYLLPQTAFYCRRFFETTVVGFYHTDFPTAYVEPIVQERLGSRLASFSKKRVEQYARDLYNRCDATVTSSRQLESKLKSMGIDNVRYISLGVDINQFHPAKRNPRIRRSLGLEPGDAGLIYAGRLDGEKRADLLVHAFNRISDHFPGRLILMGEGPLKLWIKEQCRHNSKITLLPYEHNREKLASFLASSDIYVTAGPHETFGLSVIEAQASGLCVIGVDAGALKERVPASLGVLCRPDHVESMANAMMETVRDSGFRQMGIQARATIEAGLSWQHTFARLFGLYDELSKTDGNRHRKIA